MNKGDIVCLNLCTPVTVHIIVLYDNIVWLLYEFICVCDKLQALPASHLNNGKMLQPQWDQRFVGYSYHKFLKKNYLACT